MRRKGKEALGFFANISAMCLSVYGQDNEVESF